MGTSALTDTFFGPLLAKGTLTPAFRVCPVLAEAIAAQVGSATECFLDRRESEGLVALVVVGLCQDGWTVLPPETAPPNSGK